MLSLIFLSIYFSDSKVPYGSSRQWLNKGFLNKVQYKGADEEQKKRLRWAVSDLAWLYVHCA